MGLNSLLRRRKKMMSTAEPQTSASPPITPPMIAPRLLEVPGVLAAGLTGSVEGLAAGSDALSVADGAED